MSSKTIKGKVLPPRPATTPRHPAAVAADSDLVRLTREFESLREQLAALNNSISSEHESIDASAKNHETVVNFRSGNIAHLQRQRRTVEVQLTNVSELLRPLVGGSVGACDSCISQPLNRLH